MQLNELRGTKNSGTIENRSNFEPTIHQKKVIKRKLEERFCKPPVVQTGHPRTANLLPIKFVLKITE